MWYALAALVSFAIGFALGLAIGWRSGVTWCRFDAGWRDELRGIDEDRKGDSD